MPEIRAFSESDLPAVLDLLAGRIDGWDADAGFLRETLLDHPQADPAFPSLVAFDSDGTLLGFIGSQPRKLRVGDEVLTGVVCSHLTVSTARTAGPAGALLLARLLRGEQALTWSDSANAPVARIFRALKGELDHARAMDWMMMLRPTRWISSNVALALRERRIRRDALPVAGLPVHVTPARVSGFKEPQRDSAVSTARASPREILDAFPNGPGGFAVSVVHDAAHLEHLFSLVRRYEGPLVARIVRRDEIPIGWFAYVTRPSGVTRVLHLAAAEVDAAGTLTAMIDHASANGVTILAGRADPHLDQALAPWRPVLGYARQPVIHCRDAELRAKLSTSSALLTQLDSEWFVP